MEVSKIDINKVTSGYDAEINLTEEFFLDILRVIDDADEILQDITITKPDTTVHVSFANNLKFRSVADGSILADTFINVLAKTKFGNFEFNDPSILVEFNFYLEQMNPSKSGRLWLEIKYKGLDLASLSPYVSEEERKEIEKILQKKIYFQGPTGIAGSLISSFAMKGFHETDTHQSAVGLYINYPFIVEADGTLRSSEQVNIGNAQCILSSKNHTIAVAISSQIYPMMEAHQKYQFAELHEKGYYFYPIYKNMAKKINQIATLDWVKIYPLFLPSNAIIIRLKLKWKHKLSTGTVEITSKITASIDNSRRVKIGTKVESINTRIDTKYFIQDIIIGGAIGLFASMSGGFLGLAIGGILGITATQVTKHAMISMAENEVRELLENALSEKVSPLQTIPNSITILRKRWDPFFYEHYQLVNTFEQLEISELGIFATCDGHSFGRMLEPILNIELVGVTRDVGERIIDFIYKVPSPEEIQKPKYPELLPPMRKVPNSPPDEFMVCINERADRINRRLMQESRAYVTPKQVYLRNNQIKYFKFNTGLVLTPQETAKLEMQNILVVCGGYRRIYNSKYDTFYYRSRKNINELDNLANLPKFEPREELLPVVDQVLEYDWN